MSSTKFQLCSEGQNWRIVGTLTAAVPDANPQQSSEAIWEPWFVRNARAGCFQKILWIMTPLGNVKTAILSFVVLKSRTLFNLFLVNTYETSLKYRDVKDSFRTSWRCDQNSKIQRFGILGALWRSVQNCPSSPRDHLSNFKMAPAHFLSGEGENNSRFPHWSAQSQTKTRFRTNQSHGGNKSRSEQSER